MYRRIGVTQHGYIKVPTDVSVDGPPTKRSVGSGTIGSSVLSYNNIIMSLATVGAIPLSIIAVVIIFVFFFRNLAKEPTTIICISLE